MFPGWRTIKSELSVFHFHTFRIRDDKIIRWLCPWRWLTSGLRNAGHRKILKIRKRFAFDECLLNVYRWIASIHACLLVHVWQSAETTLNLNGMHIKRHCYQKLSSWSRLVSLHFVEIGNLSASSVTADFYCEIISFLACIFTIDVQSFLVWLYF